MADPTPLHEQWHAAPVQAGDVLADKYLVERVLGVGGMGAVVAAQHRFLGGRVALKFVLPELSLDATIVQRFLKEAQSATRITSEHVARVSDVGVLANGAPYMVMEYLEGDDLSRVLSQRGPLPVAEVVDYVLQASQAIAEAHAKGIVHRDLKPANLFLTRRADGTPLVKVLDFGIAKAIVADGVSGAAALTSTRGILGSPQYMSPEQIRNSKNVDARSDVWAVGVILYELLTGALPFGGEDVGAVLAAILTEPAPRLRQRRADAPEALERVILGCLEKDPARRTQSVVDIAEQVAAYGSADARLSLSRISGIMGRSGAGRPSTAELGASSGGVAPGAAPAPAVTAPVTHTGNWGGTISADAPATAVAVRASKAPLVAVVLGAVVLLGVGGLVARGVLGARGVAAGASAEPHASPSAEPPVIAATAGVSAAQPVPLPSASVAVVALPAPDSAPSPSALQPSKPAAPRPAAHPPAEPKPQAAKSSAKKSSLDNLYEERR